MNNKEKYYLSKTAGISLSDIHQREIPEDERHELGLGSYGDYGERYHPMNVRKHREPRWFAEPFMSETPENMNEALEETAFENLKEELLSAQREGREPDLGMGDPMAGQFKMDDDFAKRMGLYMADKYPDRYEAATPPSAEDRKDTEEQYSKLVKERQALRDEEERKEKKESDKKKKKK